MADHDQEKTEKPTGKKRADARNKGQVAQSREIPSLLVLLSGLSFFFFGGSWMFSQLTDLLRELFQHLHYASFEVDTVQVILLHLLGKIIIFMAPLLGMIAIAGIVANVAQTGFVFSEQTLMPNFSKLNPLSGIKRLISIRSLVELLKSIIKLVIIGVVAYSLLHKELEQIPALVELDIHQIFALIYRISLKIGFYTCLVLAFLAGLDLLFQRWQFEHDLRMTKQEIKDEHKQQEGDPRVKARIRSVQRQMAMRRMMEAVPKATVVITNPTHFAVAIKFDRSMEAPMVVAKGAGPIAARIKEIAGQHNVPIIEEKPLARALYKDVEIGHYIPVDLYHAVAEILAYVYRLKGILHTA